VNTSFEQLLHCDRGHWPPSWIASGLTFVWPGLKPALAGDLKPEISDQLSGIRKAF